MPFTTNSLLGASDEAKVRYEDAHFTLLSPGKYVVCAISGQKIALDSLKYWSVTHQEAYASAQHAFEAYRKHQAK